MDYKKKYNELIKNIEKLPLNMVEIGIDRNKGEYIAHYPKDNFFGIYVISKSFDGAIEKFVKELKGSEQLFA